MWRHEYKHYISPTDYWALRARLRQLMVADPNADQNGVYRIRSLYFDNYSDKVLREKLDGVNEREKFRLRFYNGNISFIRLEKKEKQTGLCCKTSAIVSLVQCRQLLAGDWSWLTSSAHPLLHEFHAKSQYLLLRPKTVVDYTREAYLYPYGNVRVTLDYQLRTGLSATDFLNPALPTVSSGNPDTYLLEVKYDNFLPQLITDIIQTNNRQATAFSKYAACRIYE